MAILENTRAVGAQMVEDVRRILFWTTIVVQCVFFAFYGYEIYINTNNLVFLIFYSTLFSLSFITFINYLLTHNKNSRKLRSFKRFLRVFKYIVNGSMLAVNIVNIVKYPASDLTIILLTVSAISLFIQLIIEFVRIFAENYVDMFKVAIDKDFQFVKSLSKIKDVKGNIWALADAPLEFIANKLSKKETEKSKEEEKLEELNEKFQEERKMQRVQESKERVEKEKGELKEHFGIIKNKIAEVFKKSKDEQK